MPISQRQFAKKFGKSNLDQMPKNDYSPFKIKLNSDQNQKPSVLDKLKSFLQSSEKTTDKETTSKDKIHEKTINERYQDFKKKLSFGSSSQSVTTKLNKNVDQSKSEQQNAIEEHEEVEMDPKKIQQDQEKIDQLAQLINTNINRKYFSEKKLSNFFEICYQIKNTQMLRDDEKFRKFVSKDLKFIVQSLKDVENLYNFVKFVVYFKIDQDPELMEILADQIKRNMGGLKNDEILEIIVNFSHTLSPETQSICEIANEDFIFRLSSNYNPADNNLYIQHEDFPKILNTLLDLQVISHELKQTIIQYMQDNLNQFNYTILSELAVIYSNKMDQTYKIMFFELFKGKFMNDLQFLDQDTLYKILWSLVKADVIEVSEKGYEWQLVKEAIIKKAKDISPQNLTNLVVLSTVAKKDGLEISGDLFDTLQPEIIIKMQTMTLTDLINLLWSAQEINRGSEYFYQQIEKEITQRIRSIQDDDLMLLIECFSETQSNFSQKFMDMVLRVINEKKDKFQIKTLVGLIFTFSKIDFNNEKILETLQQFKQYERLKISLPNMLQKSQCILLWTYSRDDRLLDKEYLQEICQAIINYQGPKFELDNFDILLLCQAITHIERSDLGKDHKYMNQFYQLASMAETFTLKNLPKMNIHEFTTIFLFYLQHDHALTKPLLKQFLSKVEDSVSEFNELQLSMFQKSIIKCGVKNQERFERAMFQQTLEKIQNELDGIQAEKEFIENEERIVDFIHQRLRERVEGEAKPFKPTYTNADSKLEKAMPKSTEKVEQIEPQYAQPQYEVSEQTGNVQQKHKLNDQNVSGVDDNTQDQNKEEMDDKEAQQKLMKYLKNRSRKQ